VPSANRSASPGYPNSRAPHVDTINGTVRLTGTVNSWSEHDAAVAAAWAAPGVIEVDDRVSVRF